MVNTRIFIIALGISLHENKVVTPKIIDEATRIIVKRVVCTIASIEAFPFGGKYICNAVANDAIHIVILPSGIISDKIYKICLYIK